MAEPKPVPATPIGGAKVARKCRWAQDQDGDHHLLVTDPAGGEQRYATVCPHHPHADKRGAFRATYGWGIIRGAAATLEAAKLLCEMSLAEDRNFPP